MSELAIEAKNVSFAYEGISVLQDVNLEVKRGDFLAVLGPNGGGKSTLLKILLGLLEPDSGTVAVLGHPPGKLGGKVGYLPQYTHVSTSVPVTVLDAVLMGLVRPGLGGAAGFRLSRRQDDHALEALAMVGMEEYASRRISDLSGGQKQRVFTARALVSDPELLLLDEPTASVDQKHRKDFFRLLADLNERMTVVMVTHDISSLTQNVKSVACVNKGLHFHDAPEITEEMHFSTFAQDFEDATCPIELVTHGPVPHRVLALHPDDPDVKLGGDISNATRKGGEDA